MRISIPNQITLGRLALAIVFFVLLSLFSAENLHVQRWVLKVCFWLFLIAALTDVLDGLLARLMKQVTSFGRIIDPVVDKVMVCGAFAFFASHHFWDGSRNISDVAPWMVVVILLRELLVSGLRSHAEGEGQDFGATWVGKIKMFVQAATVCFVLAQLAWDLLDKLAPLRTASVWITVVVTALSTVSYARRAYAFLLSSAALGGTPSAGERIVGNAPHGSSTPADGSRENSA